MRALVAGGTGFLGLNIALALQSAGSDVAVLRRRSSNTLLARRHKLPLVTADLADVASLTEAMTGRDVVVMAAGHYPRYSVDTERQVADGVTWLLNTWEAARRAGVRRFLYTSSSATIGRARRGALATEADGWADAPPGSTYFAVKLGLERALMEAAAAGDGPELVVLCPTACLGPLDWKVGTGSFVLGMLTGALEVFVDGPIDVVDVRDVAAAHVRAASDGRPGERYLLGGHAVTLRGLLAGVADRFGVPLTARELSAEAALALATEEEARCHAAGKGRPRLVREFVDLIVHGQHVDCAKAASELGFAARPLVETLDDARAWYEANGYLRAAPGRAAQSETQTRQG